MHQDLHPADEQQHDRHRQLQWQDPRLQPRLLHLPRRPALLQRVDLRSLPAAQIRGLQLGLLSVMQPSLQFQPVQQTVSRN